VPGWVPRSLGGTSGWGRSVSLCRARRRRSKASSDQLFEAAAQSCVPLIKAALQAALDTHFPRSFFLNVNVPVAPQQNKVGTLDSWDCPPPACCCAPPTQCALPAQS